MGKKGDADAASDWLRSMISAGVQPNVVSFSAVLKAWAKVGDVGSAEQVLETMRAREVLPNVISWTSLIEACAKSKPKRPGDAKRFFRDMVSAEVLPDKTTL